MIKMSHINPTWQKRIGLSTLTILSLSPILLVATIWSIPLVFAVYAQIAVMMISLTLLAIKYHFFRAPSNKNKRPINLNNATELKINKLLNKLAKKANIPSPTLIIENSDKILNAASSGWPYPTTIIYLSKAFFKLYPKALTQETLESTLAHELGHLKNEDTFNKIIAKLLKKTMSIYFQIARILSLSLIVFYLGIAGYAFFYAIPLNSIFTVAIPLELMGRLFFTTLLFRACQITVKLCNAYYQRSKEFLADHFAAQLTQNPKAVSLCTYELDFHRLRYGECAVTSPKWGEMQMPLGMNKTALQKLYRQRVKPCQGKLTQGEYFRKITREMSKFFDFTQNISSDYGLKWKGLFLNHPSSHQRRQMLKRNFPNAFRGPKAWTKKNQQDAINEFTHSFFNKKAVKLT